MSGGYKTVILKGRGIRKEALAGGVIQPGDLIFLNSAGKYLRHATAGGKCGPVFAVEQEMFGKGIGTNYANLEQVEAEAVQSGAEVQVNIAAAAAAIVVGDLLSSAGDGTLKKAVAFSQLGTPTFVVTAADNPIARAMEALDNSGGATILQLVAEIL